MTQNENPSGGLVKLNKFTYKSIYSLGEYVYTWEVRIDGDSLEGAEGSVRACHRNARRAVKRYRKMKSFLNP